MLDRNILLALIVSTLLSASVHAQPRTADGENGNPPPLDTLVEACQAEARLTPHPTGRNRNDFTFNYHVRKMVAACRSLAAGVRSGNAITQEKESCVSEAARGDLLMMHEPLFRRHVERQKEICNSLAALGQSGEMLQNEWRLYAMN